MLAAVPVVPRAAWAAYGKPMVDGDDLAIISRTSIRAPDQHDADYATVHRVRDFRKLALNLLPDLR